MFMEIIRLLEEEELVEIVIVCLKVWCVFRDSQCSDGESEDLMEHFRTPGGERCTSDVY